LTVKKWLNPLKEVVFSPELAAERRLALVPKATAPD
jgi:hypothetical protein